MRLTLAGKLVVFLVIASAIYYAWTRFAPPDARARVRLPSLPGRGGGSDTPQAQAPGGTPGGETPSTATNGPPPAQAPATGGGDVLFVSTPAKRDWVNAQVEKFQRQQERAKIVVQDIASREAMQAILNGKVKPVLWSPGETIWPTRLAEAWRERHSDAILDTADPGSYRIVLRSPLVFLTTRRKAQFLRPLLGSTRAWASLRELSMGKRPVPWGRFRFSHADPVNSSSGMLTFALVLNEFNAEGRDPVEVAQSTAFARHLGELERALVYDEPARKGTTALVRAYLADMTRYDVITGYESHALDAAAAHPELAVIYPNPTAYSDHAVVLLNGNWITSEQRERGRAFLTYLGGESAQADAVRFDFRPGAAGATSLLDARLRELRDRGFRLNIPSVELPPYDALNDAAYLFINRIVPRKTG